MTNSRYQLFVQQVADQVIEYADQYKCSLAEALTDWEGNGPEGQFGLQSSERRDVEHKLNIMLSDASGEDCFRST